MERSVVVVEAVVELFGVVAVVMKVALVLEVVLECVAAVVAVVGVVGVVVVVVVAAAALAAVLVSVGVDLVLTSMYADEHVGLHGEPHTGVELQYSWMNGDQSRQGPVLY